ncbi:contact-dependent growth inhibition system immunity protein [Photorhabdus sp. SF281]|uniref:contact-dependent growth inhibition system immunity protein n=1 Tax=Photorhabdus sp. SF281 TaxID=3459527 RepID=UPI004044FC22
MNGQYPFLDILVGAYFCQDYDLLYGETMDEVIDCFLNVATQEMIKELIEEIDSFINTSKDIEKDFDALYYSDFDPDFWDTATALGFLNYVSKRAQDFLNEHTEKDE